MTAFIAALELDIDSVGMDVYVMTDHRIVCHDVKICCEMLGRLGVGKLRQ